MDIKESQSWKNMEAALAAEAVAYVEYFFYAAQAKKDDYSQIQSIFLETADNELHHAKIYLKLLQEGAVMADPISVDPGILKPTVECLKIAAQEEEMEGVKMYKESAEVAEEEGFHDIADVFNAIAEIENHHKERFDLMRWQIENDKVWKRDKPIKWQCLVCGYIFEGTEPPEKCPACSHPYQHFMPAEENV